jgi:hypothetical protein
LIFLPDIFRAAVQALPRQVRVERRRFRRKSIVLALLLNVLWILFGGLWMAVGWAIAGVLMAITIIGLPWTRAAFTIAAYTLLPFGQKAVSREEYFGRDDLSTGPLGLIGNIICSCWRAGGWRSGISSPRSFAPSPSLAFPSRGRI